MSSMQALTNNSKKMKKTTRSFAIYAITRTLHLCGDAAKVQKLLKSVTKGGLCQVKNVLFWTETAAKLSRYGKRHGRCKCRG